MQTALTSQSMLAHGSTSASNQFEMKRDLIDCITIRMTQEKDSQDIKISAITNCASAGFVCTLLILKK